MTSPCHFGIELDCLFAVSECPIDLVLRSEHAGTIKIVVGTIRRQADRFIKIGQRAVVVRPGGPDRGSSPKSVGTPGRQIIAECLQP